MADNVTAPQFQIDVNNAADWANGDENTTVTMRLGQQADSPAKVIKRVDDLAEAQRDSIDALAAEQRDNIDTLAAAQREDIYEKATPAVKGAFEDGFTFEDLFERGKFGTEPNETYWVFTGGSAGLPHAVTAGTDPTLGGPYEQVTFTSLNDLDNLSERSDLDSVFNRNYNDIATLKSSNVSLSNVGQKVKTDQFHAATGYGGAEYIIVLTSTVTPNEKNIIQSTFEPAVSYSLVIKDSLDITQFGANETDDSYFILEEAKNLSASNFKLTITKLQLVTTDTIKFDKDNLDIEFIGGASINPIDENVLVGLQIGTDSAPYPTDMRIVKPSVKRAAYNSSTENIGILYLAFNESTIEMPDSRLSKYNHKWSPSQGGSAYNTYINPKAVGGFYNFWMHPTGTGFVNENTIFGGRGFTTADTDTNLIITRDPATTNNPNNNRWYSPSLEGSGNQAIYVQDADSNLIHFPRTEGSWVNDDVVFGVNTKWNIVESTRFDLTITDNSVEQLNMWTTRANGSKRENGVTNQPVFEFHRSGLNNKDPISDDTALGTIEVVERSTSSSSKAVAISVRNGRDGADSYSFISRRSSDGLVRTSLTTDGRLTLARQINVEQSGYTFEPLKLGNYRFWVDSDGKYLKKSGVPASESDGTSAFVGDTQLTVGAAGSASALPATPAGYATIVIAGNEFSIPYYNK